MNRDKILTILEPYFPKTGSAGVYISKDGKTEMAVAGDQITIIFND